LSDGLVVGSVKSRVVLVGDSGEQAAQLFPVKARYRLFSHDLTKNEHPEENTSVIYTWFLSYDSD
jgi:hypothetical protein